MPPEDPHITGLALCNPSRGGLFQSECLHSIDWKKGPSGRVTQALASDLGVRAPIGAHETSWSHQVPEDLSTQMGGCC